MRPSTAGSPAGPRSPSSWAEETMRRDERERREGTGALSTAGGHLPPARSALTLRLVLAAFGLIASVAGIVLVLVMDAPFGFVLLLGVIALSAVVDLIVVARRKA